MKKLLLVASVFLSACSARQDWIPTVTLYTQPAYVDPYAPSNYVRYEHAIPNNVGRCRLFGCVVNDKSLICACIDKITSDDKIVTAVPSSGVIIGVESNTKE